MIVYGESSAILAWLLREADGPRVEAVLASSGRVILSDLTLVECDRAIHRGAALGRMTHQIARQAAVDFAAAVAIWETVHLLPPVIARARQSFAPEPIRALDALHVASALHVRASIPELLLLSLDNRIRRVGETLGFELKPA